MFCVAIRKTKCDEVSCRQAGVGGPTSTEQPTISENRKIGKASKIASAAQFWLLSFSGFPCAVSTFFIALFDLPELNMPYLHIYTVYSTCFQSKSTWALKMSIQGSLR